MSSREQDLRTSDLLPGGDRSREPEPERQAGPHDDGTGYAVDEPDRMPAGDVHEPDRMPAGDVHEPDRAGADAGHGARPAERTNGAGGDRALVDEASAGGYRDRWMDVQAAFVDEPRRAVAQADGLVAEVIQQLAETFAREREGLERQWDRGDEVSTEDLRVAMQRYRAFFDRLLSA